MIFFSECTRRRSSISLQKRLEIKSEVFYFDIIDPNVFSAHCELLLRFTDATISKDYRTLWRFDFLSIFSSLFRDQYICTFCHSNVVLGKPWHWNRNRAQLLKCAAVRIDIWNRETRERGAARRRMLRKHFKYHWRDVFNSFAPGKHLSCRPHARKPTSDLLLMPYTVYGIVAADGLIILIAQRSERRGDREKGIHYAESAWEHSLGWLISFSTTMTKTS